MRTCDLLRKRFYLRTKVVLESNKKGKVTTGSRTISQGSTWGVMICDWQRGFKISQPDSLWSWAFSRQEKKDKNNWKLS